MIKSIIDKNDRTLDSPKSLKYLKLEYWRQWNLDSHISVDVNKNEQADQASQQTPTKWPLERSLVSATDQTHTGCGATKTAGHHNTVTAQI